MGQRREGVLLRWLVGGEGGCSGGKVDMEGEGGLGVLATELLEEGCDGEDWEERKKGAEEGNGVLVEGREMDVVCGRGEELEGDELEEDAGGCGLDGSLSGMDEDLVVWKLWDAEIDCDVEGRDGL
jgi:hypothetical protein